MSINLLMKDLPEADISGRLPIGYQELEYIEFNGTQRIDTGLIAKAGYTIKTKLCFTRKTTSSNPDKTICAYTSSTNRVYYLTLASEDRLGLVCNSVIDAKSSASTISLNTVYDIESQIYPGNSYLKVNGSTYITSTSSTGMSVDTGNLRIGGLTNTTNEESFCGKLYSLSIYENEIIKRDFVLCRRKSDNVLGLYDLVTNTFFTNQGTGNFIAGPEIPIETTDFYKYCKSLYIENCPKVNSWGLLNNIYDYQKDHQIEIIKENIWSRVLEAVPGLREYNFSDEYIKKICLSDDPISKGSEVLNTINACLILYPDLEDRIIAFPEVINNIIEDSNIFENYIKVGTSQYIDTLFKPNQDTHLIVKASKINGSGGIIFGTRNSSTSDMFMMEDTATSLYNYYYNINSYTTYSHDANTQIHKYEINKNTCLVDNNTIYTSTYANFQCTYNLTLINYNNGGSVTTDRLGKLYYCKIYDNGTLIRHLVPYKYDGHYCMLDLVNNTTYNNAGTGEFEFGITDKEV